jgi:hypothetical protein
MSLEARYEDLGADIAALRAKEPQSMNLETDVAELRAKEFQLMNLETEVAQLRLRAAACGSGTPGQ